MAELATAAGAGAMPVPGTAESSRPPLRGKKPGRGEDSPEPAGGKRADRISDYLARLRDLLRQSRLLLPLQILALWPLWRWYAARAGDGSDEPLGPLALLLVLGLLWGRRREFRAEPRAAPLLAAALLTLIQAGATDWLPLVRALLGVTALGALLAGCLRRPRDAAPLWALLALSLPLVASLQFFAGYPLRLLAAAGAAGVLRLFGLPVLAEGAGLRWGERLVLVDAPCSGVHMLWVGLVMAAAAAALVRAGPARLALNGGLALVLVLIGNVLRNAALFVKESGLLALPEWTHAGIGVALFALVLVPLALACLRGGDEPAPAMESAPVPSAGRDSGQAGPVAALLLLLAAGGGFREAPLAAAPAADPDPAWPTGFEGRELIRLPLSAAETRWLRDFPGAAARFTDGSRQLLIRRVERPTRMLHPAADCYRGLGYAVAPASLREFAGERWSCFGARKDGATVAICERIHDGRGGAWTDASAWYWSALLNRSRGPWWAVTVAEAGR